MLEGLNILVVDDREDHGYACSLMLNSLGAESRVVTSGEGALRALAGEHFDIAFVDFMMPEMDGIELLKEMRKRDHDLDVVMMTAYGTIPSAVEAMKLGAYDYLTKPFSLQDMERVLGELLEDRKPAIDVRRRLRPGGGFESPFPDIVGTSPAMLAIYEVIQKASQTDSTILIEGGSGTGKEIIAHAIHRSSPREAGPFVTVDCGAINQNLIESELFGHVRGAFTGAHVNKVGMFKLAHGGTLFLDEVGEIPLEVQTKLLRALEERKVRPVGSTVYSEVDVRIIAATNRDLNEAIREGQFRNDLYYRLNVIQITVPALKERKEDIPFLVHNFLKRYARPGTAPKTLDDRAMKALLRYDWPGNVRELENTVERAYALGSGATIGTRDLPAPVADFVHEEGIVEDPEDPYAIEDLERDAIIRALERTGWDKKTAAQLLKIDRSTLYRKIKRYRIFKQG